MRKDWPCLNHNVCCGWDNTGGSPRWAVREALPGGSLEDGLELILAMPRCTASFSYTIGGEECVETLVGGFEDV